MKTKFTQVDAIKSARKTWDFSPVSRRVESKKKYSRKEKFVKNDE